MTVDYEKIRQRIETNNDVLITKPYKVQVSAADGKDIDILHDEVGVVAWVTSSGDVSYINVNVDSTVREHHTADAKLIVEALKNDVTLPVFSDTKPESAPKQVSDVNESQILIGRIRDLEANNVQHQLDISWYKGVVSVYERLMGEGTNRER